jgi:hypothetical protein
MKIISKRTLLVFLVGSTSVMPLFADTKGAINTMFSTYGVPICIGVIVLTAIGGLIGNMDKIMDHEGRGTRKEGFINMAWIMGGVVVLMALIGGIVALVDSMSISI